MIFDLLLRNFILFAKKMIKTEASGRRYNVGLPRKRSSRENCGRLAVGLIMKKQVF